MLNNIIQIDQHKIEDIGMGLELFLQSDKTSNPYDNDPIILAWNEIN